MARGSGNKRGRGGGGGTTRQAALRQQQNQNRQNQQQHQQQNRDQNEQPTQQHHATQPIEQTAKDIVISDEKKKEIIHNDVTDILEKDLNCAICREVYINPLLLNCSHSFCRYCAYLWLNKRPGCPTCRVTVTFQAENLALRNVINTMYQKLEETHQTKRASVVSQRLKDEEQQEKDGVIPQILKVPEASRPAGSRRNVNNSASNQPAHASNPNDLVYVRMLLTERLRARAVPSRRARDLAMDNIRVEEQRNDPDFIPTNPQYSSDDSGTSSSDNGTSSEEDSDLSSYSETSSDDADYQGNDDELMYEDDVLDVINQAEFAYDHPLDDPIRSDLDRDTSDSSPSEMSTESDTSTVSSLSSPDTSSDDEDESEPDGQSFSRVGGTSRFQRNRLGGIHQLLPGYMSRPDSDSSDNDGDHDDDNEDHDDDDDEQDDYDDEQMSLAFDDRYSNNSTVEYGTSSDEFSA